MIKGKFRDAFGMHVYFQTDFVKISISLSLAFLTTQMVKYNEDLWIGMNDINWEMHFVWTDGKGIQYTNWAKGQPSSGPPGRYSDKEVPVLAA